MVASDAGVVAVGVPSVNLDQSAVRRRQRRRTSHSATAPSCVDLPDLRAATSPRTTIVGRRRLHRSAGHRTADTAPAATSPRTCTTTNVGAAGTAPCRPCTADTRTAAVGARSRGPISASTRTRSQRCSPRGSSSAPMARTSSRARSRRSPTATRSARSTSSATDSAGYVATAQLYDPLGGPRLAKLYTSADGLTWTESDMPAGQYNFVNVLTERHDRRLRQRLSTGGQPFTAVSTDGVEWSKVTLASLLDPDDGKSAQLNVWMAAAGPGGITAVAGIDVDRCGRGRWIVDREGRRAPDDDREPVPGHGRDRHRNRRGARSLRRQNAADDTAVLTSVTTTTATSGSLNADGTVRVTFTNADMQTLYRPAGACTDRRPWCCTRPTVSTGHVTTSRPIVGFDTLRLDPRAGDRQQRVDQPGRLQQPRRAGHCQDRRPRRHRQVVARPAARLSEMAASAWSSAPARTGRPAGRHVRARRRW